MYQRRCRKVENVSSGEPLMTFTESTKFVGGLVDGLESIFLCQAEAFLGCNRLDFEYCQII